MLKRIWLFLVALFITWQVGAEIGAAFPVWPFDGFGAPGNSFTPNFAFFIAFLVDAIFIWIALKLVISFVQLAWPASQRYGATVSFPVKLTVEKETVRLMKASA